MTMAFTHLKLHSHYTMMGATASPEKLVARALACGMQSLALTDANSLYGAIQFQQACLQAQIKPIIGMSLSVQPPNMGALMQVQRPSELVLLAKNNVGYRSLCRLSSALQAHADRDQRLSKGLDWSTLAANRAGLIALEPGQHGTFQRLWQSHPHIAQQYATHFAQLFGKDGFFGLQLHRGLEQAAVDDMLSMVARLGLASVALQPVYCLDSAEITHFPLLAAINHNAPLDAVRPEWLPYDGHPHIDLHFKSPAAIAQQYANWPNLLDNIALITDQCEPSLPSGKPIWPKLTFQSGNDAVEELTIQATQGALRSYGSPLPEGITARLAKELDLIGGAGFAPLFLIVADVVAYAISADVPVSTRGSVANSLVAYCTGITTVDPIEHDLLFERFLNPARKSLPDIDLDFCSRRRDLVLAYVREKYGHDKVAAVATINHFKKKSAVREVAKALGMGEKEIGRLSDRLPTSWHPDPRRRDKRTLLEFSAEFTNPLERDILIKANSIMGMPHHLSVHPGGTVITPGPLTDVVPLQWANKGFVITQFDHADVERVGLPKLDLLGIRALTVGADSAELVRQQYDPAFDLNTIDLADPATQETLRKARTIGVFQFESEGARATLRKLKAQSIRDLAVANAFFKPGPATGGMATTFVRRYRGEERVRYLHPSLEPILASTKGVMIFQEQILRVVREIGGLDWVQANQIRKGMSKFDAAAIHALEQQFLAGCQRASVGLSLGQAKTLWQQVVAFAGYGFNQGHATSYGDVSYRAAYLKTHYPAAFLCSRLANGGGYHHPSVYVAEAQSLGIIVRAPHINHSDRRFTLERTGEQETLWMGLGWIRSLRRSSAKAIMQARPFASLADLRRRVPLQAKEITHLIQCGSLDGLGPSRAALLAEGEDSAEIGQLRMGFVEQLTPDVAPESAETRIAWETHLLGFPVTDNPASITNLTISHLQPAHGQPATISGMHLPSWSSGFLISDGTGIVQVRLAKNSTFRRPKRFHPVTLSGIWVIDEWGNTALQLA